MRLVLDTNVVISGLLWGGLPRQLLELGRDGQVELFTSSVLLIDVFNPFSFVEIDVFSKTNNFA